MPEDGVSANVCESLRMSRNQGEPEILGASIQRPRRGSRSRVVATVVIAEGCWSWSGDDAFCETCKDVRQSSRDDVDSPRFEPVARHCSVGTPFEARLRVIQICAYPILYLDPAATITPPPPSPSLLSRTFSLPTSTFPSADVERNHFSATPLPNISFLSPEAPWVAPTVKVAR